jgi:hypothetical protein
MKIFASALLIALFVCLPSLSAAQNNDLAAYNDPPSRLRGVIEKYQEDRGILNRFYSAPTSPNRSARFKTLYAENMSLLVKLDFDKLNHDEQVDYMLFKNYLDHEIKEQDRHDAQLAEIASLIPFMRTISDLEDTRRTLKDLDSAKAAVTLNDLAKQIIDTQKSFEAASANKPKRTVANRAAQTLGGLRNVLRRWYTFYNAYDPIFTWWCQQPYKAADDALTKYTAFVSEKLVGIKPDDKVTIIGDPIGREALIQELKYEMIPYTPEELIQIANKEFAWCENEMKKASREMGTATIGKRHSRL